jgi:aspartate racemase
MRQDYSTAPGIRNPVQLITTGFVMCHSNLLAYDLAATTTIASTPCLGLIGGLGVGATIHYYQELVKAQAARGLPLHLLIVHADVNRVLSHVRDGNIIELAEYLAGLIRQLQGGGAQIAAVSAITPHICISELVRRSPLPLVNLVAEVAAEIRRRGLKRVALFGTRFVMESALFGQLEGIAEVVKPKPDEVDLIHEIYLQLVGDAAGSAKQFQALTQIAHTLCARDGAEAVVLAGTELSLVFNEGNTDFPHIDCARLHIEAIMRSLAPSDS